MPPPEETAPVRVHVLTRDERVRQAARGLVSSRTEVSFSEDASDAPQGAAGCDVAVIDLQLGGFSVVRELRALATTENIRVVMLCDRPHDRWLCMQAGADQVIVKPLPDTTTLSNAILTALSRE